MTRSRWKIGGPRITGQDREQIIAAWFDQSPEAASKLAQSKGLDVWYAYKLVHSRGLLEHKSEKRDELVVSS